MVDFIAAAAVELDDAIAFYEDRAEGLGERFLVEVQRATIQIDEHPKSGALILHRQVPPGTRQITLATFPFSVVYSEQELTVVAVAHQKQRPRYWSRRLSRP